MLSEIVKVVDGGGGGDLKCRRPEKCLVCRKNPPPPIVETRRKIVNVVGNCQSCRRGVGGFKTAASGKMRKHGTRDNMGPAAPLCVSSLFMCVFNLLRPF